ncbi:MAG TPA: hypothetical protein VIC27_10655, partial [Ktedonobacterales bacterium]
MPFVIAPISERGDALDHAEQGGLALGAHAVAPAHMAHDADAALAAALSEALGDEIRPYEVLVDIPKPEKW